MTGQPRTARAYARMIHPGSGRQRCYTALTRAIDGTAPARGRKAPPPPAPDARIRRVQADPRFAALLATGYYDEYRRVFDATDE